MTHRVARLLPEVNSRPLPELTAEETESQLDVRELGRLLWRHKWGILTLGLVCWLGGAFYAYRLPPVYQANARILVEPSQPRYASLEQSFQWPVMTSLFYQTQIEIIRSRALLDRVALQLKLVPETAAVPVSAEPPPPSWRNVWGLQWRTWLPPGWLPPPMPVAAADPRWQIVEAIRSALLVSGGDKSQILEVSYLTSDPQQAAAVVNAVIEAYVAFTLEAQASTAQEATQWLGARLTELRQKLADSEAALRAYQAKAGFVVDTQRQDALQGERLNTLGQQLLAAQAERARAQVRYEQVRNLQGNAQNRDLADLLNDPALSALKLELLKAENKVAELESVYGEKHPKMIAAQAELRGLTQRFRREVSGTVERLRKEVEIAAAQERELTRLIDAQKSSIRGGRGDTAELAKMEREVETTRQLYDTFLTRFKQLDTTADNIIPNVRVLDRAQPPNSPAAPDRQRIALGAGLLGLLLGMLLALLQEKLNNTFRAAGDLEGKLGLPVLGTLPLSVGKKGAALIERAVLAEAHGAFGEAIHAVRTGLQYAHIDQPPQVILITSSFPGEGKTTLASNLALAFSQLGPTLLVDADLRRPRLSKTLNVGAGLGLADVAAGQVPLAEVLTADAEAAQLQLLSAGTRPPNPLDLLASERLAAVVRQLRERFQYIILDAPPVIQVSDAIVLAHLADGVVFVVKAETTPHTAAQDAVKRLLGARANLLGAVLSQLNLRRAQHYYGYRYGYYYRGYYGQYGHYGNTRT